MKTIFITCIRGIISRNILSTDAFRLLAERPDLRLVIVAPQSQASILEKEYGGPNVLVEGIEIKPLEGRDKFFWVLSTNLLSTGTRSVQRRAKFGRDRNIFDYLASRFLAFLGGFGLFRSIFRFFSSCIFSGREFDGLFSRYRPELIFATDIYELVDVKLINSGRRHGIKRMAMVRSWDNITSKIILMVRPELVLVNSKRDKEDLMDLGDVRPELIKIVGVPHYDGYVNFKERTSRDEFCRSAGLDPKRRFLLFTPPSDRYLKGDPVTPLVLNVLSGFDLQVLVRMPLVGQAKFKGYQPRPNIVFDQPGNSPDFVDVHLDSAADRHLADSIFHSAIVITWASTMIIDAVVFNKPIILVGFDARPRPYSRSILQYYDYDHQRRILKSGGVRLARSPEELAFWVRRYLAEPKTDEHGRKLIVEEHCGQLDGRAGERLANFILSLL